MQISEKFQSKLHKFKNVKLELLTKRMERQIFCDGTVYTGSAGLAFYYFTLGIRNGDNLDALKVISVDTFPSKNEPATTGHTTIISNISLYRY